MYTLNKTLTNTMLMARGKQKNVFRVIVTGLQNVLTYLLQYDMLPSYLYTDFELFKFILIPVYFFSNAAPTTSKGYHVMSLQLRVLSINFSTFTICCGEKKSILFMINYCTVLEILTILHI